MPLTYLHRCNERPLNVPSESIKAHLRLSSNYSPFSILHLNVFFERIYISYILFALDIKRLAGQWLFFVLFVRDRRLIIHKANLVQSLYRIQRYGNGLWLGKEEGWSQSRLVAPKGFVYPLRRSLVNGYPITCKLITNQGTFGYKELTGLQAFVTVVLEVQLGRYSSKKLHHLLFETSFRDKQPPRRIPPIWRQFHLRP